MILGSYHFYWERPCCVTRKLTCDNQALIFFEICLFHAGIDIMKLFVSNDVNMVNKPHKFTDITPYLEVHFGV